MPFRFIIDIVIFSFIGFVLLAWYAINASDYRKQKKNKP